MKNDIFCDDAGRTYVCSRDEDGYLAQVLNPDGSGIIQRSFDADGESQAIAWLESQSTLLKLGVRHINGKHRT